MYQNSGACTTACFTCRFKYSAHAIGLFMAGLTFCWCNLYTFFKNIWPFCWFKPFVLPFCTYNPSIYIFIVLWKTAMNFLTNKEIFCSFAFWLYEKNCLLTSGRCSMKKRWTKQQHFCNFTWAAGNVALFPHELKVMMGQGHSHGIADAHFWWRFIRGCGSGNSRDGARREMQGMAQLVN